MQFSEETRDSLWQANGGVFFSIFYRNIGEEIFINSIQGVILTFFVSKPETTTERELTFDNRVEHDVIFFEGSDFQKFLAGED